ncbi:hypothetical protein [Melittangium boletus]|uniref:Uncharacterized protein n=1 Tax=Melittangium boletus DSM 14713 TaxID=1294270 RepID=A0A250I8A9_9BACT|nr:hypothetical protein [Melittangium boletus]ATB28104.1 hypothetical protein MEBOL_001549 [Melittangium boletus DSM 14713]
MSLLSEVKTVLDKLGRAGWRNYLLETQGLDICAADLAAELSRDLNVNRAIDGFDDFAPQGRRAIEPGDPARSLLYHALASPDVRPALPDSAYPSWTDLDCLENYIYGLAPFSEADLKDAVVAVFAYEYRAREVSTHRQHADLAFSRTGLARVGTGEALYKAPERAYTPITVDPGNIAVLPARYGVFLAKWRSGAHAELSLLGDEVAGDAGRKFLYPIRKLFAGPECLPGRTLSVQFAESHRSEKIRRIIQRAPGARVPEGLDINRAPYFRESPDPELVRMTPVGATVMISAPPAPLVREAWQVNSKTGAKERARFIVPPRDNLLGQPINRHYTAFMILGSRLDAAAEKIQGLLHLKNVVPRNAPEFVHIRRQVNPDQSMTDLNQEFPSYDGLANKIDAGDYEAALFEDGVCDGCVAAFVDGLGRELPARPAFSVVAAPSFFPRATELDLENWTEKHPNQFEEGSAQPLCEGRHYVNPHIRLPQRDGLPSDTRAFGVDDSVVAVVGRPYGGPNRPPEKQPLVYSTHFLPDAGSNEFFPGWDVTVADDREGVKKEGLFEHGLYYTTFGLGSPYPEDVKFCSAANGFWPSASPDAARTFHRVDTPTSILLLDRELGHHPQHPEVLSGQVKSEPGWDGGYGPFFQAHGAQAGVNYGNLSHTDYITASLEQRFGRALFADLTSDVLIERMACHRKCIETIDKRPQGTAQVNTTNYWMITAEERDWDTVPGSELKGRGYLFEYALATKDNPEDVAGQYDRAWQAIQPTIYRCEVTVDGVVRTSLRTLPA